LSFEKAKYLLLQAKRDLEIGCFDKAVSAAYMAARMGAEVLLRTLGQRDVPRRDDKLANSISNLGMGKEGALLMELYEARKRADYSSEFTDGKLAEKYVEISEMMLRRFLRRAETASR
jgi:uncharacterized protein (UPF0332 family)